MSRAIVVDKLVPLAFSLLSNFSCPCSSVTVGIAFSAEWHVTKIFSCAVFILPSGEPQKWLFSSEAGSVEIECDSKKQLSQKLKIKVLDKLGNPAECPSGVEPLVSIEHSPSKR